MNVLALFQPIRTLIFDVDGVMTDGSLLALENGQLTRRLHIRDGYALQLAIQKQYRIAVISGGNSQPVIKRLRDLGLTDLFMGTCDKKRKLAEYMEKHGLEAASMLYMGDDIPDYEAMQLVHLRTCPQDASTEIKSICQYISPFKGGQGCVRDVIEKVLKLNGDWQ